MPVPTPNANEEQDAFISRCMGNDAMVSEFPDEDQRAAVCFDTFREKGINVLGVMEVRRCRVNEKGIKVYDYTPETAIKAIDRDERTVKAIISTDKVDRDGDIVLPKGLDFSDFMKNPVVLFQHDHSAILGKSMWKPKVEKDGTVVAKTQFAKTPLADEVFDLISQGILKGLSIGMDWLTMSMRDVTEKELRKRPDWAKAKQVIDKADVLEYSVVTIPSNPDALIKAYRDGELKASRSFFHDIEKQIRVAVSVPVDLQVTPAVKVRPAKVLTMEQARDMAKRALDRARGYV